MILTVVGVMNMCSDCKQELRESWVRNPDGTVQKIYSCGCVLTKEEADDAMIKSSSNQVGQA